MRYLDLVRASAKVVGIPHDIDDETADYILWEYTGFPEFYEHAALGLERQLLDFMRTWRDTGKWPPLFD
jgi:hypothetical protein